MITDNAVNYQIVVDPNTIDLEYWESFINTHSNGNVFQSYKYYLTIRETQLYKPVFIASVDKSNKRLNGIILGVIQLDYKGIRGFFTRRCIIVGGPIVTKENEEVIYSSLLKELNTQLKHKVLFTQFQFFVKPNYPQVYDIFLKNGYYYEDYLNILVQTDLEKEVLWKQIKKTRKVGINKGEKQNFIFSVNKNDDAIHTFYELLVDTYKKIKKPIPEKNYFLAIKNNILENVLIFQLEYNEKVIMSCFCLLDKSRIYAYYVGIDNNQSLRNLKPADFFYWQIILWCHDNGIKYFDWMGAGKKSEKYGVRDFKLQYGGELFENGRMSKFSNKYLGLVIKYILNHYWKKK